ncbi:sensor histidine kinase [Aquabacterium sp. J223]|uniref:sensor histidine kinase n=1 Tax=Aquabacterium sp. J223 TaxID=2898431 RepID=UPI0021AD7756|nr:ATP-binding protein [Aquabacterium sp. J223]UUX97708.1 ATP-binding protein [Aquabacterium sp. J223]
MSSAFPSTADALGDDGAPSAGRASLQPVPPRAVGRRLQGLLAAALLACLGLFLLTHWLAGLPRLDAAWRTKSSGQIELVASPLPALQPHVGDTLLSLHDGIAHRAAEPLLLLTSSRWLIGADERRRQTEQQALLDRAFASPQVTLLLSGGTVTVAPQPRGFAGLGSLYWLLSALALLVLLAGLTVPMAMPAPGHWMYAVMAACVGGNLLLIAIESLPGLGRPALPPTLAVPLNGTLDLATTAAGLTGASLHPVRLASAGRLALVTWSLVALLSLAVLRWTLQAWPVAEVVAIAFGAASLVLLGRSYRRRPHPIALVLSRLGLVLLATLLLLVVAVIASAEAPSGLRHTIGAVGTALWFVFFASLLLLVPFLLRSQRLLREFALLAGISTIATSLDLLFITLFSATPLTSLTVAVFASLGLYAGARRWLVSHLLGQHLPTAERVFDQLYRVARRVEAQPQLATELCTRLLRELFEPLEWERRAEAPARSTVLDDGSALLVPLPDLQPDAPFAHQGALLLRFARHGRRLFTLEEARLADRVVDQLRQAVAHDRAVEQGRREERIRIAQDLHDDIGARLLTLMYKAPTPEVEDYLRHTLQDLKTLTRGLAAEGHGLHEAAADWKADALVRLSAARCELHWRFQADREVQLTVVQWSALTRLLRELLTNVLSHARASQVLVEVVYQQDALTVTVADDGIGRDPQAWAHGLGLGGVRKRARLLGGQVRWEERPARGIVCRVHVPKLSAAG